MKFSIILKFKDGMTATVPALDVYDIHGDGDMFRLMIKGKLDNKTITLNDSIVRHYNDLQSFEVVFIEE